METGSDPETTCFSFAKEYGSVDASVGWQRNLPAGAFFVPEFPEGGEIWIPSERGLRK